MWLVQAGRATRGQSKTLILLAFKDWRTRTWVGVPVYSKSPQKLVSYFGLNPRGRQSGLGVAHHGTIRTLGRSHARAILVEAAWSAAKAPGPLHAFFVRLRARRGHQIAAVAVARKLTVLCWHLLTRGEDYLWARPALVPLHSDYDSLSCG